MRWEKLGLVYRPSHNHPALATHAANPVAELLDDGGVRVYFSGRDSANRSSIGCFEFDVRQPGRVTSVQAAPLLTPGPRGAFDDSGLSVACLVAADGRRYLYYLGWTLRVTVPWQNSIGLAVSPADALGFERVSPAPVLDRSRHDPYSLSYPWILREDAAWRMWYGSNLGWGERKQDYRFVIKYAESPDGLVWTPGGRVCIPISEPRESGVARPCVVRDAELYRMWYSYRSPAYRMGYAESEDGISWERLDHLVGIDVSDSGWDSEMIEYPCVFDADGERYMLYNGNGFGASGIGLAVLDSA